MASEKNFGLEWSLKNEQNFNRHIHKRHSRLMEWFSKTSQVCGCTSPGMLGIIFLLAFLVFKIRCTTNKVGAGKNALKTY